MTIQQVILKNYISMSSWHNYIGLRHVYAEIEYESYEPFIYDEYDSNFIEQVVITPTKGILRFKNNSNRATIGNWGFFKRIYIKKTGWGDYCNFYFYVNNIDELTLENFDYQISIWLEGGIDNLNVVNNTITRLLLNCREGTSIVRNPISVPITVERLQASNINMILEVPKKEIVELNGVDNMCHLRVIPTLYDYYVKYFGHSGITRVTPWDFELNREAEFKIIGSSEYLDKTFFKSLISYPHKYISGTFNTYGQWEVKYSGLPDISKFGNTQLYQIILSEYTTKIPDYSFFFTKLSSFVSPKNCESIEGMVFYGTPLKTVTLNEGLKNIGRPTKQIWQGNMNYMEAGLGSTFGNCQELTSINIPSTLEYISADTFFDTPKLLTLEGHHLSSDKKNVIINGKLMCTIDKSSIYIIPDNIRSIADGFLLSLPANTIRLNNDQIILPQQHLFSLEVKNIYWNHRVDPVNFGFMEEKNIFLNKDTYNEDAVKITGYHMCVLPYDFDKDEPDFRYGRNILAYTTVDGEFLPNEIFGLEVIKQEKINDICIAHFSDMCEELTIENNENIKSIYIPYHLKSPKILNCVNLENVYGCWTIDDTYIVDYDNNLLGIASKNKNSLKLPEGVEIRDQLLTDYTGEIIINNSVIYGTAKLSGSKCIINNSEIKNGAFNDSTFASIEIHDSIIAINTFNNMPNLGKVYISNNSSNTVSLVNVFNNCLNLNKLELSGNISEFSPPMPRPNFTYIRCSNIPSLVNDFGKTEFDIYVPEKYIELYKQEWTKYSNCIKSDLLLQPVNELWVEGENLFLEYFSMYLKEPYYAVKMTDDRIGSWFYGQKLYNVCIPEIIKYIEPQAFSDCTELTSVALGNNVNTIGKYAFSNCNIIDIKLPLNVKFVEEGAFQFNNSTQHITLNDGLICIEPKTFMGTGYLSGATLKLPDTLTTIKDRAFKLSILKEFELPESLEYIGDQAFNNSLGFSKIRIPKNVKYIGKNAFTECKVLTDVYFDSEYPPVIKENDYWPIFDEKITIHVPSNSIGLYKKSKYFNQYNIVS